MKKSGLSHLERSVRETVEGSFGRLFGGYLEPVDVATRLVQAMEDNSSPGGAIPAYDVTLNPADYHALLTENPYLADALAEAAWEMGRRYDLPIYAKPVIRLRAGDATPRHAVRVTARYDLGPEPGMDTTQVIGKATADEDPLQPLLALDAFLVVQGRRHVALVKPLTTIGRRPDNDIVIDSASVSRQHAQIRWRFERFILYDVSNRGRTKVNGQVVTERVLEPGDVIALSDAVIIYAEGNERDGTIAKDTDLESGDTQVLPPQQR